jgi:hypothetical protein
MATIDPIPPRGLIDDLVDEYGWTPEYARAAFDETAECVAASVANRSFPPALGESIERVWRRWILHTSDYMAFVDQHGPAVPEHPPVDGDLTHRLKRVGGGLARRANHAGGWLDAP